MSANKNYKDSVFTTLFNDKAKLIELYNALEGTDYGLDVDLEINTLENALYMNRKNDISFTLDGRFIVLIEYQSSINENMPLRFLLYIARVYEKLIDNKAIYKEQLIRLPRPEFIVLYNGKKPFPKEKTLRLSDAFAGDGGANLELVVRVVNIKYEESNEVLKKSQTLEEYSYFVYKVKRYLEQGLELEESIESAIRDCIKEGKLKKFLEDNGSEVVNMLFTEFNLEDAKEVWLEEGREEGEKKASLRIAYSFLGELDDERIAEKTGLTLEELKELKERGL